MSALYYNTNVEYPSPESLPFGQDNLFDWDIVSEDVLRSRGWVKFDPPTYDADHEQAIVTVSKDALELPVLNYEIVSRTATANTVSKLKALVSDRRWRFETGGVNAEIVSFVVPTTAESIAKIDSLLNAYYDEYLKEKTKVNFNIGENTAELTLKNLEDIKQVIVDHTQACHTKQANIFNKLDEMMLVEGEVKSVDLRDFVYAELEASWSKYAAYVYSEDDIVVPVVVEQPTAAVTEETEEFSPPLVEFPEGYDNVN